MKAVKAMLAGTLLLGAACATNVGEWDGASKSGDAAALRNEVRESLTSANWGIIGDTAEGLVAGKPGTGGHRSIANFTFQDSPNGASFKMRGGSHHRFNWATLGVGGLSTRNQAYRNLTEWYEAWVAKHPTKS
jgi:hypothetical protein